MRLFSSQRNVGKFPSPSLVDQSKCARRHVVCYNCLVVCRVGSFVLKLGFSNKNLPLKAVNMSVDVRVLTFVNFVYMRGGMCVRDEAV